MSVTSLVQAWQGLYSSRDGSATVGGGAEIDPADCVQVALRMAQWTKGANDAMAADATTAQDVVYLDSTTLAIGGAGAVMFPNGVRVLSVSWTPQGNVTANATNFATLILEKATGAGAATTVASFATDTVTTDDLTALVPKAIPLSATLSDTILTSGQSLRFRITKTAAGVVVTAGRLQVIYQVL